MLCIDGQRLNADGFQCVPNHLRNEIHQVQARTVEHANKTRLNGFIQIGLLKKLGERLGEHYAQADASNRGGQVNQGFADAAGFASNRKEYENNNYKYIKYHRRIIHDSGEDAKGRTHPLEGNEPEETTDSVAGRASSQWLYLPKLVSASGYVYPGWFLPMAGLADA